MANIQINTNPLPADPYSHLKLLSAEPLVVGTKFLDWDAVPAAAGAAAEEQLQAHLMMKAFGIRCRWAGLGGSSSSSGISAKMLQHAAFLCFGVQRRPYVLQICIEYLALHVFALHGSISTDVCCFSLPAAPSGSNS